MTQPTAGDISSSTDSDSLQADAVPNKSRSGTEITHLKMVPGSPIVSRKSYPNQS